VTDEPTPPAADAATAAPQPPTETAGPATELSEPEPVAEPEPEPVAEPQPSLQAAAEPAPEPSVPAPPAPEAKVKAPRRRLALGLAAALVAVVAGGGIGYAVLEPNADGKAAAKTWKAPKPKETGAYGAKSGGSHYGTLGKLLLPMPEAYVPGPDVAEFGNDAELSGKEASDLLKNNYRGLPKKQRQAAGKSVDQLHIQGIGMRTYSTYGQVGNAEDGLVIEIQLVQMKNKQAARAGSEFFAAFAEATGVFRKGPKIAGHSKATCVLPPREKGVQLDQMLCEATEGDLLVTLTATGTTPFQKNVAADLLKQQLDRVKDPGEAV
jgi:hypothetical protein